MSFRLLTSAAALALSAGVASAEYSLTILHTNDFHARFEPISKYDSTCGAEANAAKFLAAEAGYEACQTAVMSMGGMGYAQEYHVERYFREVMIPRIAPVSPHQIMNYIAERVLELPKSY